MSDPSREFPDWHVIAQSSGKRYGDPHDTYIGARNSANFAFMKLDRNEHWQVFHDDGSGKFTMIYDATVGEPLGISLSELQEVIGRDPS